MWTKPELNDFAAHLRYEKHKNGSKGRGVMRSLQTMSAKGGGRLEFDRGSIVAKTS